MMIRLQEWQSNNLEGVLWTASRSDQSILKINPGISLEGMMLKLKLRYFGHLMRRVDSLEKTDVGRDWGQEEKRMTEDGMAGWHHWLDGHEFEWTPGVGDGQGGLACCIHGVAKSRTRLSDLTEPLGLIKCHKNFLSFFSFKSHNFTLKFQVYDPFEFMFI